MLHIQTPSERVEMTGRELAHSLRGKSEVERADAVVNGVPRLRGSFTDAQLTALFRVRHQGLKAARARVSPKDFVRQYGIEVVWGAMLEVIDEK
jgi:hypothetical protein